MEEVNISELKPEKIDDKEHSSKDELKNKGEGDILEEAGVEVYKFDV